MLLIDGACVENEKKDEREKELEEEEEGKALRFPVT